MSITSSRRPTQPRTGRPTPLMPLLTDCVDRMLQRARDRYGEEPSLMLADGFNARTGEHLRWRDFVPSNLARQQNFLRVLDGLATLTGNGRYRLHARAWIDHALVAIVEPKSHLFHWGGHGNFDLITKQPMFGKHELKYGFPYYRFLHEVNPWTTERFIEALWVKHVQAFDTLLFNRHGFYTWWPGRTPADLAAGTTPDQPWEWAYAPGELPIVQTTTQHCAFRNIALDMMFAALQLHGWTGQRGPLTWATRLMERFEQMRHPDTGLGVGQYSHHEPCRVRESLRHPWCDRSEVNECTIVPRWALWSNAWAAVALAGMVDEIGPAGQPFVDHVVRDLEAVAAHMYDRESHCFLPGLYDGTRIEPADIVPGKGYLLPSEFEPVEADGLMFLAYARTFRVTGRESFYDMALSLAQGMGWRDALTRDADAHAVLASLPRVSPFRENLSPDGPHANLNDACALVGVLELHRATGEAHYLDAARVMGQRLIDDYYADGFFHPRQAGSLSDGFVLLDDSVLWALVHLAAAEQGRTAELPTFYAVNSYYDPKILARRLDAAGPTQQG